MRMPDFKSLFETPQKARLTIICLAVALATFGAVILYIGYSLRGSGADAPPAQSGAVPDAPDGSGPPSQSDAPPESSALVGLVPALTIGEARELALSDAGVAGSEADITREALAEDNGIWVYEFRFRTADAQYEYKLNANTGDVRSKVKETFVNPASEAPQPSVPAESASPAETGPQPSARPQPEQDGGPAASTPPESASPSASPSPAPSQSASMYIGMERAKSIALGHAGLSASQVRFTHTRMDREDGRMVYEIEFREGRVEYEYEIDAATGRILDYERDAH